MRGGEKALEVFCELYPDADLFTLVHIPGTTSPVIEDRRVVTSFLQWIPGVGRHHVAHGSRRGVGADSIFRC